MLFPETMPMQEKCDEADLLGENWYADDRREASEERGRFHEIQESYRD